MEPVLDCVASKYAYHVNWKGLGTEAKVLS